jgi:hypothetical protein
MKSVVFTLGFIFWSIYLSAQPITCPDPNFKRNNGNSCSLGGRISFTFSSKINPLLQIRNLIMSPKDGGTATIVQAIPNTRWVKPDSVEAGWCFDINNIPPPSQVTFAINFYIDLDNNGQFNSGTDEPQGCGSNGPILPVSFLSFEAQKVNQTVALNWVTVSEIENAGFYVERKAEGEANFSSIGYMMSGLAGGTGAGHTYRFIDPQIPAGRLFYRLRQVDWDGTTSYSEVVTVSNNESAALKLLTYPNPSNGNFKLALPSGIGNTNIELKRVTGEVVSRWNNYSSSNLSFNNLNKGMYLLRVNVLQTGETLIEKIMVH